jgi:hypothetical protein
VTYTVTSPIEYRTGATVRIGTALYRVIVCKQRPHEAAFDLIVQPATTNNGTPVVNRKTRRTYTKQGRKI